MYIIKISGFDAIISFIYVLLILVIGSFAKNTLSSNTTKKYFSYFLYFKILCAIIFVILHAYVYRGGDTYLYFAGGKFIGDQILNNPAEFITYLFGSSYAISHSELIGATGIMEIFGDTTTLTMSQITAIFYVLGFKQFLASTILISFFSFFGSWLLFSTLCRIYPKGTNAFTFCVFFYPSLGIWGSGILKDTVTLAAVGFILAGTYNILTKRNVLSSFLLLSFSAFLCLKLKPYILYTLLPAMLLIAQGSISKNINNTFLKTIMAPVILVLFIAGGAYFFSTISNQAGKYSLDNVQEVAEGFQSWHTYLANNRNQSGYNLGEISFTPLGVLQKSPEAIFVTFYRPRPDEIRNFATAFESVQSTTLLLITLYIFFKVGFFRFFRIVLSNNYVRAFLFFSIFLGMAVGITSYNFGALSRYKIPCLPFFTAALVIIYYEGITLKKRKKAIAR